MNYKNCRLYGLKSKKQLLELLHIDRNIYCKSYFINSKIKPYIDINNEGKKRLVEAPDVDLKKIQSYLLRDLQRIDFPNYVFSGIKGKCYIDNAKVHSNYKFLFKIDISKFFPNISRDKIYKFYQNKLNMSPDIANILTNLITINLDMKNQQDKNIAIVNDYIKEYKIKSRNHLITGSPVSSIMSYLANVDMFEEIYRLSQINNIIMTVYVDDITFSSNHKIPCEFRTAVLNIITKNGYTVSKKKCKLYNIQSVKKVTGVILDKEGKMQVPNKLMLKTHNYIGEIKKGNTDIVKNLKGCLVATTSINGKLKEYNIQLKKQKFD